MPQIHACNAILLCTKKNIVYQLPNVHITMDTRLDKDPKAYYSSLITFETSCYTITVYVYVHSNTCKQDYRTQEVLTTSKAFCVVSSDDAA